MPLPYKIHAAHDDRNAELAFHHALRMPHNLARLIPRQLIMQDCRIDAPQSIQVLVGVALAPPRWQPTGRRLPLLHIVQTPAYPYYTLCKQQQASFFCLGAQERQGDRAEAAASTQRGERGEHMLVLVFSRGIVNLQPQLRW